jgi:radical SAM superfamily enzyme YgiQ (UPF0313 family)
MKDKKIKLVLICLRSEHFTPWNPLSIESLAGYINGKFGEKVEIKMAEFDSGDRCSEYLNQEDYNIVGFSISQFTVKLYEDILRKTDLTSKIILCGSQIPTYLPEETLKITIENSNVKKEDILVVRGEGERPLEYILNNFNFDLESNFIANKNSISNICYIQDNDIMKTESVSESLEGLIYPPMYSRKKQNTVMLQTSKGCCWGRCVYCSRSSYRSLPHSSWQSFPMERIRQDIHYVITEMEVVNIEFCDDDFIGKSDEQEFIDRAYKIGEYIGEYSKIVGRQVTFRIFTRPDVIAGPENTREPMKKLLRYLKDVGLSRICMGIEAGNNSQLKAYRRGLNISTIKDAINTLREEKIGIDTGFIMFYPGLQLHEMVQNISFYKEMNLIDSNQWVFRPLLLTVGTPLFSEIFQPSQHQIDIESMSIPYKFDDLSVGEIHNIIDTKSAESKNLFYALKQISKKDFDYSDELKYNYWALEFCKKNGMIYLDFLEQIASSIIYARKKLNELADTIKNTCPEIQDINNVKENVSSETDAIDEFVSNIVRIEQQKCKNLEKNVNAKQCRQYSDRREAIGNELRNNLLSAISIADTAVKILVEEVSMKLSFDIFEEQDKPVLEKNIMHYKSKYGGIK